MVREKKRVKFIENGGEKEMENVEEDKLGEKIKVGYVKKKMRGLVENEDGKCSEEKQEVRLCFQALLYFSHAY